MSGQIYEVEISEDGRLDFQTQVPDELKGKKLRLILLADDEWESSTDELQEAVDQDWAYWLDVREDIYRLEGSPFPPNLRSQIAISRRKTL